MAKVYIKTNPSRSREAVPPPPPARPRIKLDNNWSNIDTDDGNHSCVSYIEGAAKFQQRAIEELENNRPGMNNYSEDDGFLKAIDIIKNLKIK